MRILCLLIALPFITFGAGGTCPASVPSGITGCYFVAANGSDSNDGLSEASGHPWLHAPQMPNCSNNCATVQNQTNGIQPGTGIIFRGGDTWHLGNSSATPYTGGEWNFNTGQYPMGTSANPIYIGVDQTWYTGSSWARPIFTLDNPVCGPSNVGGSCSTGTLPGGATQYYVSSCAYVLSPNNMIDVSGLQYYIFDNLELTGLCQTATGQPSTDNYLRYGSLRNPVTFQNLYIHGWTHIQYAYQNSNPNCSTSVCFDIFAFQGSVSGSGPGEVLTYDVVDGTDSDPAAGGLCFKGFYDVSYSVFRYVATCLPSDLHTFHDNLYEWFYENGHSDVLAFSENASSTDVVYNNVFRNIDVTGASGTPVIWPNPPSTTTVYMFNNLIYNVGNVEYLNIGNNGSTYGSHYIFNNTWQTSVSQTIYNCQYLSGGSLYDTNNHNIDDVTPWSSPCNNLTTTTDKTMTNATATTDGYTSSQTYAYSPTSGSSPTVTAGTNVISTYCAALTSAGMTAAATACQSDTTYGCTYNSTSHTNSCPARTVVARPSSTAPDVGVYEYQASSTPTTSSLSGNIQGVIIK